MAVRLHGMGYCNDAIDRVRTLGDPTFTVFFRAYMASLTSVMGSILQIPDNSRWWNMAMQEEMERVRSPAEYMNSEERRRATHVPV